MHSLLHYYFATPVSNLYSTVTQLNIDINDETYILGKNNYTEEEKFFEDVFTRFHFTYRRLFAPTSTGYTSDAGFGCMVRSCSMLVAECFQQLLFGRGFVYDENNCKCPRLLWLTSMFTERMSPNEDQNLHPFSVNNLIETGQKYGIVEGKWFSPSSIANTFKDLIGRYFPQLDVYVRSDNTIFFVC
jgi:hypothetical protein